MCINMNKIFVVAGLLSSHFLFASGEGLVTRVNAAGGLLITSDSIALPQLNAQIIAFVNSKMKKRVGRGECWDLAAEALNAAGAKWNGKLIYGRLLDLKKDTLLPGDIIQFEGVKIKFEKNGVKYKELINHHTGIVYEMKAPKQFMLANQNTSQFGKKVGLTFIDLAEITQGKYFIYRAVNR